MYYEIINITFKLIRQSVVATMLMCIFIVTNSQAQDSIDAIPPETLLTASKQSEIELKKVDSLLAKKEYSTAELVIKNLFNDMKKFQGTALFSAIHIKAGQVYYKQRRFNLAIAQYQKALSLIDGVDDESKNLLGSVYHEIAQCYKHLKNPQQSIHFYQQSLDIHQTRNDSLSVAIALKNIAMAENKQQNYIRALDHVRRSLSILSSDSTSLRYAQVALITGIIYRNIGHFEKSLNFIQQAKVIYERHNDIRHLAEVDNQMGLIYTKLNQLENAKSFYNQTIDLAITKVKPETRAAAFRELGVIYYQQGSLEKSIDMLNTALRIYQSASLYKKTTRIDLLLGRSYLKQEELAIASDHFEQTLALAIEFKQVEFQIQSLNHLAEIMLSQDVDQAILLLERALTLSSKVDDKVDRMNTYHWLTEGEKIKGNLKKALQYSNEKFQVSQLIREEREALDYTKHQVTLATYKLEVELNDLRENADLNTLQLTQQKNEIALMQQSQIIAELEINKNRFTNLALIAALSVFFVLIVYILYQYRSTRAINRELDYLASRDPLTNCYNRRLLYSRFKESFEAEEKPTEYAVILADIDAFKTINDTHGHTVGDKVLQGIAKVLLDGIREGDTLARFGGEEFCILLPHATQAEAEKIAERIRHSIENTNFETLKVTCSFGIASFNNKLESDLTLIEQADIALYQSKSEGKNRVTLWHHKM